MSDTPRRFKVGDYVVVTGEYSHPSLREGKKYLVTESYAHPHAQEKWVVRIDGFSNEWSIVFFKLDKNTIIKDIINDL